MKDLFFELGMQSKVLSFLPSFSFVFAIVLELSTYFLDIFFKVKLFLLLLPSGDGSNTEILS